MKKIFLIAITLSTLFVISSCSHRLIDFTVISNKNVNIGIDMAKSVKTSGKSIKFLGINANIKDAMESALNAAGPGYDLLINGVVRLRDNFFTSGYIVEGEAVKSSELKAELGEEGFKTWCETNNVFMPDLAKLE